MASVLLALLSAYLLGSFPSAQLLARLQGRDIFTVGSGNMGAMNTARNVGFLPGLAVLLLDVAKGAAALLAAGAFTQALEASPLNASLATAAAALGVVAGHAWPLFTRFRGGKALAVSFGVLLVFLPLAAISGLLLIIILSLALPDKGFAAILTVFLLVPLTALLAWWQGTPVLQWLPLTAALLLMALIIRFKYLTASVQTAPAPPPSAAA